MNALKSKRWWLGWKGVVGLLVLAGVAWFVKSRWFSPPPMPKVITAEVRKADLEDNVLASGTVKAIKQVSVGAQVSGQVKKLYVALGDQVKQGQLIAEIDADTQTNTLRNAEAALRNAQATRLAKQAALVQAELTFKREQELLTQDATSRETYEAAKASLDTLKAEIAAQEAQIEQNRISADTARVTLGYTRILAPMDGRVVAVVTEEGRTVNATQSAPTIIKLAKLDTVTVKAQISEADVVRVKPGLPVYFTILGESDKRYEAKLRAIEPVPESEQTDSTTSTSSTSSSSSTTTAVYYNGLFDVPNPEDKLRVSMTAQVSIVLARANDALVIPSAALSDRRDKEGRYEVRVLEGDEKHPRINPRKVRIGLNNRVQAQVLEGLNEGDKVVVGEAQAGESGSTGRRGGPPMF
ncbi:MAG TPA: efflux RND transporter periplasmic adaptor subunit [Candidatus Aquabacterium excrementipullorum]|nr:efflux RND transporter periplasmic adaptor subunit [Candidatus Aquabacterium excrementipullorum]